MRITGDHGNIKNIQDDTRVKKGVQKENVEGKEFKKILAEKTAPPEKTPDRLQNVAERAARGSVDNVLISNEAAKAKLVEKAVRETPDIRIDKVNEIKAKIASGNYNVSAEELADKMIDSGFIARLLRPIR